MLDDVSEGDLNEEEERILASMKNLGVDRFCIII